MFKMIKLNLIDGRCCVFLFSNYFSTHRWTSTGNEYIRPIKNHFKGTFKLWCGVWQRHLTNTCYRKNPPKIVIPAEEKKNDAKNRNQNKQQKYNGFAAEFKCKWSVFFYSKFCRCYVFQVERRKKAFILNEIQKVHHGWDIRESHSQYDDENLSATSKLLIQQQALTGNYSSSHTHSIQATTMYRRNEDHDIVWVTLHDLLWFRLLCCGDFVGAAMIFMLCKFFRLLRWILLLLFVSLVKMSTK